MIEHWDDGKPFDWNGDTMYPFFNRDAAHNFADLHGLDVTNVKHKDMTTEKKTERMLYGVVVPHGQQLPLPGLVSRIRAAVKGLL